MPDYDAGFKIVAHVAGRELAELAGVRCQRWQPISGEVQAIERLADRAFRAQMGQDRFVVYMEAYTRWQSAAPWSVLAKSGLLSERERLPTVSLLYVLLPRGYRAQGGSMQLRTASGPTQQVWFREICLWQQEPRGWEETPGLMPLYPLCRHQRPQPEALTYPAKRIADQVADRSVRADLLTTLGLFGRLVYPHIDVFRVIGREQMKESSFYREIMDEGRIEAQRADIQQALAVRFGAEAAAEFADGLSALTDREELSQVLRLAVGCRRLGEFRRALTALPAQAKARPGRSPKSGR